MPIHLPALGAPCWFELASTDPKRSIGFAQAVFGWSADEQGTPMGAYAFMANATAAVGAICGLPPGAEGAPSFWNAYVLVADCDASRSKAIALGATPFGEPFDVPGMGRGAMLADPGGAVFNLWQADPSAGGDLAMFEDHSIGWIELATRDVDAAQAFYGALLGWSFKDSSNAPPGTRYSEYAAGDTHYGGLLQMTKAMALDHAKDGVRVNIVCPTVVDTPMIDDIATKKGTAPAELRRAYDAYVPTGRMVTADEVADAVLFLASDRARQITGVALPVDGGTTAM